MESTETVLLYLISVLLASEGLWALWSGEPMIQFVRRKLGFLAGKGLAICFVLLGLTLLGGNLWIHLFPLNLEHIEGRTFRRERVVLDGKRYLECTFDNVTFVYNGGPGELYQNEIIGPIHFDIAGNKEISRMVYILQRLGALSEGTVFNDATRGTIRPN